MNRRVCAVLVLVLVGGVTWFLKGSAVAQPPSKGYCWQLSPGAVSATSVDLTVAGTYEPTASILLCNDESSGGADAYVTCNNSTPVAPGASGGASWVVKATEKINIDGRFTKLKVLSSSGTISVRVLASY